VFLSFRKTKLITESLAFQGRMNRESCKVFFILIVLGKSVKFFELLAMIGSLSIVPSLPGVRVMGLETWPGAKS
jgi:hypothetical protein